MNSDLILPDFLKNLPSEVDPNLQKSIGFDGKIMDKIEHILTMDDWFFNRLRVVYKNGYQLSIVQDKISICMGFGDISKYEIAIFNNTGDFVTSNFFGDVVVQHLSIEFIQELVVLLSIMPNIQTKLEKPAIDGDVL